MKPSRISPSRTILGATVAAAVSISFSAQLAGIAAASVTAAASPVRAPQSTASFCRALDGSTPSFTDIAGNTFAETIQCVADAGIARGGPGGLPVDQYGPTLTVTRGQTASFVARAMDEADYLSVGSAIKALPAADAGAKPAFSDIATSTHAAAVERLAVAGIVRGGALGSPADQYSPNAPVTRGQMASIVVSALAYLTGQRPTSSTDSFVDDDSSVHEASINALAATGIVVGVDATHYRPDDPVRRDAMSAFVARALAELADRSLIKGMSSSVANCAAVASRQAPDVDGRSVALTAATAVDPAMAGATSVAHCDIRGTVSVALQGSTSTIGFQVKLPARGWNGQFVQLGCGGFCGAIPTLTGTGDEALSRGFAIASDDTGHTGNSGDGSFAYDNPAAELTFGQLSEHLTSRVAEHLIQVGYGRATQRSFFIGCSTGGRQAMVLAQQYPTDFDGIVAGAPALHQNELATLSQGVREQQNRDAQGHAILDIAAAGVLQQKVLSQCDGADGVVDGVVSDPRSCTPALDDLLCAAGQSTGCLTADQIRVVRLWYDSPRLPSGAELYPGGLPVGSEGGWPGYDIGTDDQLSGGGNYAQQVLRYLAFPDDPGPSYQLSQFDPARDASKLHTMDSVYNADSTNLLAFHQAGGKLIMWQGLADPLITPFGTIQYYEDVVRFQGGSLPQTQAWFRSFFLPGVYHCAGGPGPDTVDWLGAITSWVDNGSAPDRVIASKIDKAGAVTMTRPVFPYPLEAHYDGTGSPDDPSNFTSVTGPRGR